MVAHTHRLLEPEDQDFAAWDPTGEPADTLVALLAEVGRYYLPWVARAVVDGGAEVPFPGGAATRIESTGFLDEARGVLLARYVQTRCPEIDAVLDRAGILRWLADSVDRAGTIPDPTPVPRPALNQPYPATP